MQSSEKPTEYLGDLLVCELGRRGKRGDYFRFKGYQRLKQVRTVEEMQAFLDAHGFESVLAADDPAWLADGLEQAAADKTPPGWMFNDLTTMVAFPFWLLTRLPRKQRVFPHYPSRRKG